MEKEFIIGYMLGSENSENEIERSGGGGYAFFGFVMMFAFVLMLIIIYENTPIKAVLEETSKNILKSTELGVGSFSSPVETLFPQLLFVLPIFTIFFIVGYIIYIIKKSD